MTMKARSRSAPGSQASPVPQTSSASPKEIQVCRRQARVSRWTMTVGAAAGLLRGVTEVVLSMMCLLGCRD